MMDEKISTVIVLSLIFTISISGILLNYVVLHDYILLNIYGVGENLVNMNLMSSDYLTHMEEIVLWTETIPTWIDKFWLLTFIVLISGLIYESYHSKRIGYKSVISLLTIGMILFLFFSSIINQITNYIKTILIDGLLSNLSVNMTFFYFYLNNYGLINAIIISACIIASFIDLDFVKFESRKDKENVGAEFNG